jgi:c-di-GMP-binding flagellar brake protein YcgR
MDEREFLKGPLKRFLDDRGPRPAKCDDLRLAGDGTEALPPAATGAGRERRRHTRFKVVPMYSHVHVRRANSSGPALEGHLYDISVGGVRFELDEPLADGEQVTIEIGLPGCQELIQATGKVVRINDADDDPGPRRMALRFDSFADDRSKQALLRYLGDGWLEEERAA